MTLVVSRLAVDHLAGVGIAFDGWAATFLNKALQRGR
jgi:hypothetical protein